MKDQDRAVKQFAARRGKKRGGDMAFLMREFYEWDPPCQRESCGGIHPGKETGHIGFFHRTRPGRDPDGLHGSQIGLLGKFLQHLRQSSGVMKHGVALAKPKLSRTYRQKLLGIANNLSGFRVKHGQRGCVIAGINAEGQHVGSSVAGAFSSPACSRATVPRSPLTNW